jgi:hypothetical protein
MIFLVCESHKLRDSQASQYIAIFPSRETRTDISARSKSHFSQKNCETRLAVNPRWQTLVKRAYKPNKTIMAASPLPVHSLPI